MPPVITREEAVRTKLKEELEDNGLDIEKKNLEKVYLKTFSLPLLRMKIKNLSTNIKIFSIVCPDR